jgi:hypothetical protein
MSRIDFVGLARQTAGMGTKVTTMTYYVPVESSDASQNRETLEIEETVGDRFPTGLDYGTRYFEPNMAGAPRLASCPRVFSGFLGQPATVAGTGGDAGGYTHTFDPTLSGKTPEPHSIFVVRKDPATPIIDLFWDARGNELELSVQPNDFLRMNAGWIALDLDDSQSEPTPTSDLTNRRKFSECVVQVSSDNGTTWSSQVTASFGITYSNNLDTDEAVLGSRKLYALPIGNANCEVRWAPRTALSTEYRRALAADPTATAIRMTATGGVLFGALSEQIRVTVASAEVTDAPAAVSAADVLKMVEVTARAKKNTSSAAPLSGKFVTVDVVNAVASY